MSDAQKPKPSNLWVKGGPSPNPGGKPKGTRNLAKQIEESFTTKDELLRFYLSVFRCEHPQVKSEAMIVRSADWLSDRYYGPVKQTLALEHDVSSGPAPDYSRLTIEEHEIYARLHAKLHTVPVTLDVTPVVGALPEHDSGRDPSSAA